MRVLLSALLLIGSVAAVAHVWQSATASIDAGPCVPEALSAPFTGPLELQSIQHYGCEGNWAFVWATVGTGAHEIGVTEVLAYDEQRGQWTFANRAVVCKPSTLPPLVYHEGCFSN